MLSAPSGLSRAEPSAIIPLGAYGPKGPMVAPPGAPAAMALMVAPPGAGRDEAEVPVVRQFLEATAVAMARWAAELSPGGLACLPCC